MKFSIAAFFLTALSPAFAQEVISIHGSGTTNPSKVSSDRRVDYIVRSQAKRPLTGDAPG